LLLICITSNFVYANSSWHWISRVRPLGVLPFAIIATLLIEIFMIVKISHIKDIFKSIICISFANLVSFTVPYLTYLLPNELGMLGYEYFMKMTDNWPSYIVRTGYLFLTLAVEAGRTHEKKVM
jgi:hypothetical protein